MTDDDSDDLSVRESSLGSVGEHANIGEDPAASRRERILAEARAFIERADRADRDREHSKSDGFNLDAYLRQFPQKIW